MSAHEGALKEPRTPPCCLTTRSGIRRITNPMSGKVDFEHISSSFFWAFMMVLLGYSGAPPARVLCSSHDTTTAAGNTARARKRSKHPRLDRRRSLRQPAPLSAAYNPFVARCRSPFADIPVLPSTHTGRFLAVMGAVFSYLSISVFCAIITANLSHGAVPGKQILTLDDIDLKKPGVGLCIESAYPLIEDFVQRNAPPKLQVVRDTAANCIQMVHNREVQAFLDDELVIRWCAFARVLRAKWLAPPHCAAD